MTENIVLDYRGRVRDERVPCAWCKKLMVYNDKPGTCPSCDKPTGLLMYRHGACVESHVRPTMFITGKEGELLSYTEPVSWRFRCRMSASTFNKFIKKLHEITGKMGGGVTVEYMKINTRIEYHVHAVLDVGVAPFEMTGVTWGNPIVWRAV